MLGSSSMPEPKERLPTAQPQPPRARPTKALPLPLPPAVHTAGTLPPVIRATQPPSLWNFSGLTQGTGDVTIATSDTDLNDPTAP